MISIIIGNPNKQKTVTTLQKSGVFADMPIITAHVQQLNPPIFGQIKVLPKDNKSLDHTNLDIIIIGQIEVDIGGEPPKLFLLHKAALAKDVPLTGEKIYKFSHLPQNNLHESMVCKTFRIRYYVKAILTQNEKDIAVEEQDFGVQIPLTAFNVMVRYQGEFGVPDTLHVMLEFDQSGYYLDEIIVGKITLLLIKIDIKRVEIFIMKTESYGRKLNSMAGEEIHTDEEIVYRAELKKNPKKGDMIPIKINLNTLNLNPSLRQKAEGCFGVQYHLKVALFNETGAAFFRKVETILIRGVDE